MDLFRFTNPLAPTRMQGGVLVEDVESKMWVERFSEAGEFEVVGELGSGIKEKLPIGSFVSHTATDEIMMVEDHDLTDDGEEEPLVKVTGQGFETFLDQRITGVEREFPTSGAIPDYNIPINPTWTQIVHLIRNHIYASEVTDAANALPYFDVLTTATGDGELESRTMPRVSLYKNVQELLAVDGLGIKVIRPGRSDLASNPDNSVILIHKGVNRADGVMFSYDSGDVESADYLWSNKTVKNAAYIHGKWVDTVVFLGPATSGISRRWMEIDMSDIDQNWNEAPTGTARGMIEAAMKIRGKQILAAQKEVALAKAEISQEAQSSVYRVDYNVGDLVTVTGNYSEDTTMRVTEHVEIEDEEGTRSYPTLSAS